MCMCPSVKCLHICAVKFQDLNIITFVSPGIIFYETEVRNYQDVHNTSVHSSFVSL
jgi:hypothetical protein